MTFSASGILYQKRILLGVTGGIAAYKSADFVRRLKQAGAEVQIAMTPSATEFVTPLTFQALSGNPVHTTLLDAAAEFAMSHIELARWADAIIIAPCSANTLAKLAHGEADNLLTTLCLASESPLAIAPAMNRAMWAHAATQANLVQLKARGVQIFGPASGEQACGEIGEGRMLEPEALLSSLATLFTHTALCGQRIMITAGPTREAIDPVRYISNHSSGKMGFALATAAQEMGAAVTLVSGPVQLPTPYGVTRIDVESAQEMYDAVMQNISGISIFIAAAAVADYHIKSQSSQKIKKSSKDLTLQLGLNPDILGNVALLNEPPFTVGFAAETEDLETYAKLKLNKKSLNMIAANQVASSSNMGFNSDENAISLFYRNADGIEKKDFGTNSKTKLARQLLSFIKRHYQPNAISKKTPPLNNAEK